MCSLKKIKELISPLAAELELERVIVFGSYARGEQKESSDIDLIIDSGGKLQGLPFFNAVYKFNKLLPIKTDIFELFEINNLSPTYSAIMNEGVMVYER